MLDQLAEAPGGALRDRRILVVEDVALVAMVIEDALLDAGASLVGTVASVDDALRLIRAAPPGGMDGAVLDLDLCGRKAHPVAEALADRQVPFVLATGYTRPELPGCVGVVPVMGKPFEPAELVRVLARLLGAERRP
jgi:CheY-like chemotaxis protein